MFIIFAQSTRIETTEEKGSYSLEENGYTIVYTQLLK